CAHSGARQVAGYERKARKATRFIWWPPPITPCVLSSNRPPRQETIMTKNYQLTRRAALVTAGAAVASTFSRSAVAQPKESIVMGWPVDPQTWDPNTRTTKALQSLYKMVFNQPIDQAPDQSLIPGVVKAWHMSDDGKTLELDLRDDVVWHDG